MVDHLEYWKDLQILGPFPKGTWFWVSAILLGSLTRHSSLNTEHLILNTKHYYYCFVYGSGYISANGPHVPLKPSPFAARFDTSGHWGFNCWSPLHSTALGKSIRRTRSVNTCFSFTYQVNIWTNVAQWAGKVSRIIRMRSKFAVYWLFHTEYWVQSLLLTNLNS